MRPLRAGNPVYGAFERYATLIERQLNAGQHHHGVVGWLLAVGPIARRVAVALVPGDPAHASVGERPYERPQRVGSPHAVGVGEGEDLRIRRGDGRREGRRLAGAGQVEDVDSAILERPRDRDGGVAGVSFRF